MFLGVLTHFLIVYFFVLTNILCMSLLIHLQFLGHTLQRDLHGLHHFLHLELRFLLLDL